MIKINKSAQSMLGFTVMFVIILAALLVIGKYVKNAMAGKIRQAGDAVSGGEQYDPGDRSKYGHYSMGSATLGAKD